MIMQTFKEKIEEEIKEIKERKLYNNIFSYILSKGKELDPIEYPVERQVLDIVNKITENDPNNIEALKRELHVDDSFIRELNNAVTSTEILYMLRKKLGE